MKWNYTVSVITIILEIFFFVYSFKSDKKEKTVSQIILFLLLSYQILEFFICMHLVPVVLFSKIAFAVITWLPALGIVLIGSFIENYNRLIGNVFLGFALFFTLLIFFTKDFVQDAKCLYFWARYTNASFVYLFYSIYYEAGQIGMIFLSIYGLVKADNKLTRYSLGYILSGTVIFVLFSILMTIAFKPAFGSLPSIMCHFAIFLAFSIFMMLKMKD